MKLTYLQHEGRLGSPYSAVCLVQLRIHALRQSMELLKKLTYLLHEGRLGSPDDFHYSETTEIIFQEQSGDKDTEPSFLCDVELDDETIGKALSSPLFIQEREEPADRRQAYHSYEESLLPAQSFFTHKNGETRTRTWFVSKTRVKSRNGKRKNQDSP